MSHPLCTNLRSQNEFCCHFPTVRSQLAIEMYFDDGVEDDDHDDFGFDFAFPGAPHLLQNFEIYDDYDDFDDFFDAEDDM